MWRGGSQPLQGQASGSTMANEELMYQEIPPEKLASVLEFLNKVAEDQKITLVTCRKILDKARKLVVELDDHIKETHLPCYKPWRALDDLHESAREGDISSLLMLIDRGVPVDLRDSGGRTPLHCAVDCGHINIVQMLLSRKANVNAKDNEGWTPLEYAVRSDKKNIAELLFQRWHSS